MQAIILAAGMGKRLKALTANNTKCMIKVNGVTLIERALSQLDKLGLNRIVIVVGYEKDRLIDFINGLGISTPIVFVDNPIFDKTNNIYSLWLAKEHLIADDTLLLESDLIFQDGILEDMVFDLRPTLMLVDKRESWMDGTTCIIDDDDDSIKALVPGKSLMFDPSIPYYKTVNIYKFSREFSATHYVPFLEAYSTAFGNNEYYEQVLRVITAVDNSDVRAKRLRDDQLWYEIDDLQDLDIAESLFAGSDMERTSMMQDRFGGYWRYPKLIDFCYLVNPYYPPQRLMDEIKASFESLLTQYPSGMRVNSLLAAKNFGVKQERIMVGNGAAELIKAFMDGTRGKVGFVRPTFEEYVNRYAPEQSIVFCPDNPDFSYTAQDLMTFFANKDISTLVLINPDNPSGNYLPKAQLQNLAAWCEARDVTFVLDESFADFSDELGNSLIDDNLLETYKRLVVVKSISKSHGVPGARLGVLASSDEELIARLKKVVSIWNINSFGEFYMQIAEKYRDDFQRGLERFRKSRSRLINALSGKEHLHVVPSQANYLLVEVLGGITSSELTDRLLCDYSLLIKDLSKKISYEGRQYIRVAVRTNEDNDKLVEALREIWQ